MIFDSPLSFSIIPPSQRFSSDSFFQFCAWSLSKLFSLLPSLLRFVSLVLPPFHCLIPSAFNRPSSFYSSWLLSSMPSAAELRRRGGKLHQRSADDLPQAAELRRSAELHLYLPSVGGLVRLQGWQLWQGAALPGLQRWGDVLRQQSLHQAADGRLLGKDSLQNFVCPIKCFLVVVVVLFFLNNEVWSCVENCHTMIFPRHRSLK